MTIKQAIRFAIYNALIRHKWSRTKAAQDLECSYRMLTSHLKRMRDDGIHIQSYKPEMYPHDNTCTCKTWKCLKARKAAAKATKKNIKPLDNSDFCKHTGRKHTKACALCAK